MSMLAQSVKAALGSDFPLQRGKAAPNRESITIPVMKATTAGPTAP